MRVNGWVWGLFVGIGGLLGCGESQTPTTVPDTVKASDVLASDAILDVPADAGSDRRGDTRVAPPGDTRVDPPGDTRTDPPGDTGVSPPEDTGVSPPEDTGVSPPEDAASDTQPDTTVGPDTEAPDASDDVWQPPAFPSSATSVSLAAPVAALQTVLREQGATAVAALPGGRILVQDETGTQLFDATWSLVGSELDGEIGLLWETADWGEDTLLACDAGLRVLHKGYVFSSPLQTLLNQQSVHTVRSVGVGASAALWLGTETALYTWKSGLLSELNPAGLPTANARVVDGATLDGAPALWVAAGGWLYALVHAAEGLVSVPVLTDVPVTKLSVDSGQRLWLLSQQDIVLRHPTGTWEWLTFAEPVQAVYGAPHSPTTWFVLETSVALHEDGVFRLVEGLTVPMDADVTAAGDLLVATAGGVLRVTLGAVAPEVITWTGHIAPLYEKECGLCHSPDNIAVDFSSMQAWVDAITVIMTRVQTDMPADDPPLDVDSVSLIQQWIDGGFVE